MPFSALPQRVVGAFCKARTKTKRGRSRDGAQYLVVFKIEKPYLWVRSIMR